MNSVDSIEDELRRRLLGVGSRIEAAAKRSGRPREAIQLIAVSKTHPVDVLRAAIKVGMTDLGENRVQEAEPKIDELGREAARWHLIGHLQSNKARRAVQIFDMIHSIDSAALVEKLDRACAELDREELPVLIQVDLGHETTKSGADETELPGLIGAVTGSARLKLVGFMTLPPFFEDAELTRPFFAKLRSLRDEYQDRGVFGGAQGELSMGMTNDFEVAIEEGATMVRVGTAIFGARETA
ncbi:MAG TPA: YggS family pyridoxal phosphate-dependent enzyme [Pyrinomonadaceae bacterium]|nr:YggS family pyridoxal phosphate-dependent enzyme [Pyrinomonadaceae bacterium]